MTSLGDHRYDVEVSVEAPVGNSVLLLLRHVGWSDDALQPVLRRSTGTVS